MKRRSARPAHAPAPPPRRCSYAVAGRRTASPPRRREAQTPYRNAASPALAACVALAGALLISPDPLAAETIYRATEADGTVVFTDRPVPDATVVETEPLNVVGTGTSDTADDPPPSPTATATAEGTYRDLDPPAPASVAGTAAAPEALPEGSPVALPAEPAAGPATRPAAEPIVEPLPSVPLPPAPVAAAGEIDRVAIASPPPDATLLDAAGPLLVEIVTAPGSLSASGLTAEALLDGEVVVSGESTMLAVPAPERGEHLLRVRLVDVDGSVVLESDEQRLHVRRSRVADGGN